VTAERWPRVKALFEAAVERPPAERDAFLAAATGDDEAVRREVASLLTSDTSNVSFLDRESAKRTKLDELGQFRVNLFQAIERVIQREDWYLA